METGKILINGTETFVPIFNRLWEIAQEFIPYIIYIGIGAASINLVRAAVKFILAYLKKKNFTAFYYYVDDDYYGRIRHKRKHIKWKNIKHFR